MRRRTVLVGAGARVLDGSDDAVRGRVATEALRREFAYADYSGTRKLRTVTCLAISGGGEKGVYMNRPYEVGRKTIEGSPAWSQYRPRCNPTPLGGVKAAAG